MPTLMEAVMSDNPLHVDPGFTWTAAFSGGTFLALLGLIIRQVGPWRKQRDEAEQKLRDDLIKRVDKLEKTLDEERRRHEIERSLDRHKINNLTQCLDAVLLILETAPSKTAEVVAKVREMRAAQIIAEAEEKRGLHEFDAQLSGNGS